MVEIEAKQMDDGSGWLAYLSAEDAEDLAAFEERANEPLLSYDEMVKRLKKDGRI